MQLKAMRKSEAGAIYEEYGFFRYRFRLPRELSAGAILLVVTKRFIELQRTLAKRAGQLIRRERLMKLAAAINALCRSNLRCPQPSRRYGLHGNRPLSSFVLKRGKLIASVYDHTPIHVVRQTCQPEQALEVCAVY